MSAADIVRAARKVCAARAMLTDAGRLYEMSLNELDWLLQGGDPGGHTDREEFAEAAQAVVVTLDEYRAAMEAADGD